MKLTKEQIKAIDNAHKKALKANIAMEIATQSLSAIITETLGIEGNCDYLTGDGFGFTPISNDDTHIPIDDLIQFAKNGDDITEEFILDNLSL
jgi:hypothetical protein